MAFEWLWIIVGIATLETIYIILTWYAGTKANKTEKFSIGHLFTLKTLAVFLMGVIGAIGYGVYWLFKTYTTQITDFLIAIGAIIGGLLLVVLFFIINWYIGKTMFNKGKQ
jgi:hypothetical protein